MGIAGIALELYFGVMQSAALLQQNQDFNVNRTGS